MRRGILILWIAGCSQLAMTQTLLYPGDLALVNINSDGTKNFDVVLFRAIEAGTVIHFTDIPWVNAQQRFVGNEGILTYTAPSALAAGTVISCPGTTGGSGFVKTSGSFNPSTSGDNIIVYQGSAADPFFLFGVGWARGSTVWEYSDVSASYRSDIPPGLSPAEHTILALGTDDNYRYGLFSLISGSLQDLLAAIANPAQWTPDNTTPFAALTQNFTVDPFVEIIAFPTVSSSLTGLALHQDLLVRSSLTVDSPLALQSVTITPSGSVTILPGATLRVLGSIDNQAGISGLIIKSDEWGTGSLIHACDGVQGTVERFIDSGQWHFVSSPVADPGPVDDLFGTGSDDRRRIFYYDESTGQWVTAIGTEMLSGRGYNVFLADEARTVSFHGTLNSYRSAGLFQVTRGAGAGWNLLGNPFPCGISWGVADQADAAGWKNQSGSLEHKTIWITTGGSGNATTFDTYNGSSGIGVPDNGTGIIAPGQAFWVRASLNGTLGINHYAKSLAHGTFKASPLTPTPRLHRLTPQPPLLPPGERGSDLLSTPVVVRLAVTSNHSGKCDEMAVVFDSRSEEGLDRFDSEKLGSGGLRIHSTESGKNLVIQSRPFPAPTDTIPLTLTLPESGTYTLALSEQLIVNSEYHSHRSFSSLSFILDDRSSGTRHVLTESNPYTFSAGSGVLSYFLLIGANTAGVEEVEEIVGVDKVDKVDVVYTFRMLTVTIQGFSSPGTFRLYSSTGSEVLRHNISTATKSLSLNSEMSPGIYFWEYSDRNRLSSGKIFLYQ